MSPIYNQGRNSIYKLFSGTMLLLLLSTVYLNAQISGTKTIGNGGSYTTLTAAMAAINSSGINGQVILEVTSNYNLGNETFPINFGNVIGMNASNTITIRPQTGNKALQLVSSTAVPIFSINAGKYYIVDGRPGGTGLLDSNCMQISSTSGTTPAVNLQNDASYNTFRYCDIQANNTTAMTFTSSVGVISFGTTNGITGNDYNLISNCNIHGNTGGFNAVAIFGYGSLTTQQQFNDSNTIDNCNIYDFNAGPNSAGIFLSAGCHAWTITNNHFFQTTAISYGSAHIHRFIYLTTGSGYTLTGNYFGGNNATGSGMYTIIGNTTASTNTLIGIDHSTSSQAQTNIIRNNTIANIDFSSAASGSAVMVLLQIYGGNVECHNNLIGSETTIGSIKFTTFNQTAGTVGGFIGIRVGTNSNIVNLTGNVLSGIELYAGTSSYAPEFHGINLTTGISTSYYTATNNTIGSKTLLKSINIVSTSLLSTAAARLDGFIVNNTNAMLGMNISSNVVANMNTNYSASGTQAASTRAMWINPLGSGNFTVNNNFINNISTASRTTGTTVNAALIGLSVSTTVGTVSMTGNQISNLKLTGSADSAAILNTGIYFSGISTAVNLLDRNLVRHLTLSTNNPLAIFTGIELNAGQINVTNNMVTLGYDSSGNSIQTPLLFRGIYKNSSSTSIYFNTIYIGGIGSSVLPSSNTYAFYRLGNAFDDIRNNIFINNRSSNTPGGINYQVYLSVNTTLTMGYNIYMGNGTAGIFGYNGTNNVNTYAANWITGDNTSFTSGGNLIAPGGSNQFVNLHLSNSLNKGIPITLTTRDYDNDIRNNPPDIGADEIPFDIGVVSIDSPASVTMCGATKNIWVKIKNYGTSTVTAANINLNLNGGYVKTFAWTGNLLGGATSAAINVGSLNLVNGGSNIVAVNTSSPNGLIDNNILNDTTALTYQITVSLTPIVTLKASDTVACVNSPVSFSLQYGNTVGVPVFEWRRNSTIVGSNDSVYIASSLNNFDTISIKITTAYACATVSAASSNAVIRVTSSLTPKVTLNHSMGTSCSPDSVIYSTSIQNGGNAPSYAWQKNGITVSGTNSQIKLYMGANDSIRCIMTPSLSCASKSADTSAYDKLLIPPTLNIVPSISATSNTICSGVNDTFEFTANSGYSSLIWYLNGVETFSSNIRYVTNLLKHGDSVYAVMTSTAPCPSPKVATSNKIKITVNPYVTPTAVLSMNKTSYCPGDTLKLNGTFTSGGPAPIREWYKNNVLVASGSDSYTTLQYNNNDSFHVRLTSNASCLLQTTVQSLKQSVVLNPAVTPSVTVSASATNICSGTPVKFTANPANGGTTPHYTWRKNGIILGNDSSGFTTTTINNNDSIFVTLTSNALCATKLIDSSAKIKINVTQTVTPAITISTATQTFCSSTPVEFSSNPTFGGTSPQFTWMRNGLKVGSDSIGLILTNASDKDTIQVMMRSNLTCLTTNDVKSNKLVLFMIFSPVPTVAISESVNNVCKGTSITFSSNKTDPGLTPVFKWMVNNKQAGLNAATFITDSLNNNDTVMLIMTSSSPCARPATVASNKIAMKIKTQLIPSVSIQSNPSSICSGGIVTFTASDVNGGAKPVHRWLLNGFTAGTDSIGFTTNMLSTYVVKCVMTSNVECPSKLRDTAIATIVVKPIPPKPIITKSYDTLISSPSGSYQWAFNNNDINGAINKIHIATQNGSYKVTIDSNGCKNTSDVFVVANVGLKAWNLPQMRMTIWPNPGYDYIQFTATYAQSHSGKVEITDLLGKVVQQVELESNDYYNKPIDVGSLSEGTYIIRVIHGDEIQQMKWQKFNHN